MLAPILAYILDKYKQATKKPRRFALYLSVEGTVQGREQCVSIVVLTHPVRPSAVRHIFIVNIVWHSPPCVDITLITLITLIIAATEMAREPQGGVTSSCYHMEGGKRKIRSLVNEFTLAAVHTHIQYMAPPRPLLLR